MEAKEYYQQLLDDKIKELEDYELDTKKIAWKSEFYKRMKPFIEKLIDSNLKEEYQKMINANEEELKIRWGSNDIKREVILKEKTILENLVK